MLPTYFVRNIAFCAFLLALVSCGEHSGPSTMASTDTVMSTSEKEKVYDYPVQFKNWHMGDHENTRLALQMYKAWDSGSIKDMASLLDDTLTMELPDGRRYAGDKEKMLANLVKSRQQYIYAHNDILAAYPLVNTDNNDQWVNVLVYNKWKYKDGLRDSMLYHDLWKITNGKISHLVSLEQSPSRQGTEHLEKLIKEN